MASPTTVSPTVSPMAASTITATTRSRPSPAQHLALFPARAFLAFGWLRAGVEKVIEPAWWSGEELDRFVTEQQDVLLPFMQPLVDLLVSPAPAVTAAIVALVELVLGALLLSGRRLMPALLTATGLNVVFVLMGAVTPSAFYLVLQLTLVLWLLAHDRRWTSSHRLGLATAMAATAVAAAPFIRTVHPADVIHDPAIMLATIAALVGANQMFGLVEDRLARRRAG